VKGRAHVITHEIPAVTNQSYGRNACHSTAPLLERGYFRKSGIQTFDLRTADQRYCAKETIKNQRKRDIAWGKERERERERERGERERECGREGEEIGDDWNTVWNINNVRIRVLERRWDWIKTQNRVVLSSLVFAFKFTLWTFHIPGSSRYVPFTSTCGKRNDVFIFFRWTLEVYDERRTSEVTECNPVASYSLFASSISVT